MDHSAHATHAGHGDHNMPDTPSGPMCSMHMLWNTQIIDTCVVFRSWHIRSTQGFIFSCLIIVALGILYEWLREFQKKYDLRIALSLSVEAKSKGRASPAGSGRASPDYSLEESGLINGRRVKSSANPPIPLVPRLIRAFLYGLTIFLSFFLMLVFMTYNAYLIFATVLGAAIGHYLFNSTINVNDLLSGRSDPKTMACH